MLENEVSIEKNKISMCIKNGRCLSEEIGNLHKFYYLLVGSDVQANDSICYILVFNTEIWIIPEFTTGANNLRQWINPLVDDGKIIVAQIDYLPFSWRFKRFFLGMEAKMDIKTKEDFNKVEKSISVLKNTSIYDVF